MKAILALTLSLICANSFADELLFPNSDFEQGTLAGWTIQGDAFVTQPTRGDNTAARNRETSNLQGEWWIGSYEHYNGVEGKPGEIAGDGLTGTLTSDEFTVKSPYISFRIGAGNLPGEVGVKLLVDDESLELATGVDSETMVAFSADVRRFQGRKAKLQIFDHANGGWGHINVDDFRGTEKPVPEMSKDFAFTGDISATAYPDVDYNQPLRPQFHFMSKKNWINDPNGMVYDGEKYHLFFQHNPQSSAWGNMTWGHATSPDMVHWTQQDHALLPYRVDGHDGTIFSGTAVIDHNNSLGKQVGDTETLVAIYTFATKPAFYQAMAYSTDKGKTFTYYNDGRAIVPNQGFDSGERDPKVFWHEPSQQWVMALWVEEKPGRVRWFTSSNLTDWEFASDLMRDWAYECMDVVFLPVDGDPKNVKCLIYDASFDYEIGTFDGKAFHAETETLKNVRGNYYAAQSFNQAPDGRVVQMGWMRGEPDPSKFFGVPHNGQMGFPVEMTLRTTPAGVRCFCWPIKEIESLVKVTHTLNDVTLNKGVTQLDSFGGLDLVDVELTFSPGDASQIKFDLPRVSLVYDVERQTLSHTGVDREGQPVQTITLDKLAPRDGKVSLRLLVDRLTVEAYAFGGESFAAHYIHPDPEQRTLAIESLGGQAELETIKIRELNSAWAGPTSKPPLR